MTGYVYAIEAPGGIVKIGWSRNPERRAVQIAASEQAHVTLRGYLSAEKALEGALHAAFRHARVRGEWFRLDDPAVHGFVSALPTAHMSVELDDEAQKPVATARHPLTAYRAAASISLQQFGSLFGVNKSTVSRWETGEAVIPAERVAEIAQATGLHRSELRPDLFATPFPSAPPPGA